MKKINILDKISSPDKNLSIYIHIPFCIKRCFYCDFCSSILNKEKEEEYFKYLLREIDLYKEFLKDKEIVSIFIGGGTPSCVDSKNILNIVDRLNKYSYLKKDLEFTIEANPNSLDSKKLDDYLSAGINRFSIGAQSFNDSLLKKIGRIHNKKQIISSIELLKENNIKNFSLDLMLGLPEQNLKDIEDSLRYIEDLNLKHISYYSLILEENTYMYKNRNLFNFASDTEDRKMYHYLLKGLDDLNFKQYEISNFAKDGYESRHNLRYWRLKNYLSFGMSAASNIENIRFKNTENFDQYFSSLKDHSFPIEDFEILDKIDRINEYIIMALRLNKGLNIDEFNKKFDEDFFKSYKKEFDKNTKLGLIKLDNNNLSLTSLGLDFSNQVELDFFK